MKITRRQYQTEADYWTIRQFLREAFRLNQGRQHCWDVARFDYWRWHGIVNCNACPSIEAVTYLWENCSGELVAVLHPEDMGTLFLQVHPDYRTPELEEEMIVTAEERLAKPGDNGAALQIYTCDSDEMRREILTRRGYAQQKGEEYLSWQSLDRAIPEVSIPEGYTLRALGDDSELKARSYVSGKAFHENDPEIIANSLIDWPWYRSVQRAPLYRRDLDLVIQAPDGEFAAFCTVWFDDANRIGIFEPVGTDPAHRRLGLSRALIYEGLRRLQHYGATTAYVGSYGGRATALYHAVGFVTYDMSRPWGKTLPN